MKWIFILLVLITLNVNGQQVIPDQHKVSPEEKQLIISLIPLKEGKVFYEEIIEVDSIQTQTEVYNKLREWFSNVFVRGQGALDLEDKDRGVMIGKGKSRLTYKDKRSIGLSIDGDVSFTLSVVAKNGKFKYQLTDIIFDGSFYHHRTPLSFSEILVSYKSGKQRYTHWPMIRGLVNLQEYLRKSLVEAVHAKALNDF